MTQLFRLRTISRAQADLEQCVAALGANGVIARLRRMSIPVGYISFEARQNGRLYEGWADAGAVLRRMYPGISALAWSKVDTAQLFELMIEERILEGVPAPEGKWNDIRPVSTLSAPIEHVLCIEIDGPMPAWFKSYPQPKPLARASEAQSAGVPLRIDFRLGTSTLPMSLLGQIAIGDALLIQRPAQIAMVGEKPLCRFHFEGAEIMLDRQFETYEENLLQENEDGDEIYDEAEPHSDDSFRLDELPVVVEFILHRETMCFSDLRELYTGSVLTAQPDAASKVKIRANGRLVATGQLVQVGEQLAVQVQTVHFASK